MTQKLIKPPCPRCGFKEPFHEGTCLVFEDGTNEVLCLNCAASIRAQLGLALGVYAAEKSPVQFIEFNSALLYIEPDESS